MSVSAEYYIDKLKLKSHPEGGLYRRVYEARESIAQVALPARFSGARTFATSIYYFLRGDEVSRFHRIKSDEVWHFYAGSRLTLHMLNEKGYRELYLGSELEAGAAFQAVIPAGVWFGASLEQQDSFALVGCTVAPGFDFVDFELAQREALLAQYPEQQELILRLTE
ncbi:MAG: cupin domain-containing protein [Trueperaceae bacterium]|nr:cupin domain-containing protein [Trueperaceae bacterium]